MTRRTSYRRVTLRSRLRRWWFRDHRYTHRERVGLVLIYVAIAAFLGLIFFDLFYSLVYGIPVIGPR